MKNTITNFRISGTWAYRLSMVVIVLALGLLAYVYVLLFYPFSVVTLIDDPIPVMEEQVEAGSQVTLQFHFIKHLDFVPEVEFFLVNSTSQKLTESGTHRPLGRNVYQETRHIPPGIAAGIYYIQVRITYRIAPIREVIYTWNTEPFEVTERKGN